MKKGIPIQGLEKAQELENVHIFHAGTKNDNGTIVTSGGRVLGVTAIGSNLSAALNTAYEAVDCIRFEGQQYRKDIGQKGLKHL